MPQSLICKGFEFIFKGQRNDRFFALKNKIDYNILTFNIKYFMYELDIFLSCTSKLGVIMSPKDKKVVTIVFDLEKLNKIDAMADKYGVNRSQFIRNLVDVGFDLACIFEVTGALPVVNFGTVLFEKFKNALKSGTVDIQGDKAIFPIK